MILYLDVYFDINTTTFAFKFKIKALQINFEASCVPCFQDILIALAQNHQFDCVFILSCVSLCCFVAILDITK